MFANVAKMYPTQPVLASRSETRCRTHIVIPTEAGIHDVGLIFPLILDSSLRWNDAGVALQRAIIKPAHVL